MQNYERDVFTRVSVMETPMDIETFAHVFNSSVRLQVLRAMGERGMSVHQIAARTGISSATACHHLAELVQVGLAVRKRRGRESIYRWTDVRVYVRVEHVPPSAGSAA